ncbi:hypothetical protein RRL14_10240 [Citrobacter freundii]|uniref:hypothetical protein n=1 Tax=Citrobacter freundii TaxID=546 RepID=UPI0028E9E168|nr:hypothetical protein [Citrobacter freundii]WNT04127.1 hypothetical protein RRL14_10240 [Citrobacter freundii]HCL6313906.1 hypothetical protein [Citrobacter freundii]
MKSLEIKYDDGKFTHLIVDGLKVDGLTAFKFSHVVGEELPTLSITTQISGKLTLSPEVSVAFDMQGDHETMEERIKEATKYGPNRTLLELGTGS